MHFSSCLHLRRFSLGLRGRTVHISKLLFHVLSLFPPCPALVLLCISQTHSKERQSFFFFGLLYPVQVQIFFVHKFKFHLFRSLGARILKFCWLYKLHVVFWDQARPSAQGPLQPAWLPGRVNVFKDSPSDEGQL